MLTQDFDLEPVVSKFNYYFPGDGTNDNQACSQLVFLPLTITIHKKPRQNGRNVNPFGAMASVAGDRSGPWTGWIDPAPV